jgi:small Trp-rich protein
MLFLLVGIILLVMKLADFPPVALWSWLVVLSPFAMAGAWWAWADWSGYTKKREVDKIDSKRKERLDKQRENIGLGPKRKP